MRYVVPLEAALAPERFGGKAAQLAALTAIPGVRVPPGFALDAEAFDATLRAVLPAPQWPERVLSGGASARRPDRLEAIRQRVLAARLPDDLRDEVLDAWRALGEGPVAVRSSALHEDGEAASAAGLQETILGASTPEALLAAVLCCHASIYRERAMTYLARVRPDARVAVGVVIQRLVRADAAGVLFTADPVSGARDVAVVEAAFGLGSAVVDGTISPDVFRLEQPGGRVLSARVGDKARAVRVGDDGRVEAEPLALEDRARPAVSEAQLSELVATGRAIAEHAGAPRDIEWAFEAGALWVLQARPVVGLRDSAARGRGRDGWVWSNVNVGEALPGVATPLTWSIAAAFSELGFRRAFGALGCTVPEGAELVGNFHGRIYLNLTVFMQIASQVPALSPRMLLELGGGGGLDAVEQQVERGSWLPFLKRLPLTGARYVRENLGLAARVEAFERDFSAARARFEARDLAKASDGELLEVLRETHSLLDRTGAVMLTCASGYLASVVTLRGLLRLAARAEAERLELELLAGFSDLESAAPGIALFHIAEIARGDGPARQAILEGDPASLTLRSLPEGPTRKAFGSFLRAYGYRCPREAELSTPRWREAPGSLFAALRAYLLRGDRDAIARVERQHEVRASAERELAARLPAAGKSVARHLLSRTQRFARLRERMRARVVEVLGFFRATAVEVSARMLARQPGVGPDAAFYLGVDELSSFLTGELYDLVALVAARRAEVVRDLARPDPPPTFVGAPPASAPSSVPEGDRWHGVAASPGVVTGTVRVVRDPADGARLLPGEVLVTPVADVGWTPLFLVAAAVVTELGGALSHAALVAREYGVPAVVNVAGATRALANGDRVRVDGDRGVVERLAVSEAPREAAPEGASTEGARQSVGAL